MERMSERERIAREIHDTLLQGVQGLLLRLQALMASPSQGKEQDDALKTAIDQARAMVIEGRTRIIALRGISPQHSELTQSILAVGEDLASLHSGVTFHLSTEGPPRPLLPIAGNEILDIVREAIRNAFVHADAQHIDVHVAYQAQSLRVRIADDGRGISEHVLTSAVTTGHWGIVGMRERAAKLGAKLTLHRRHPRGTEWLLRVPCRAVYHSTKASPNLSNADH
jgi:signal transduction histidine kinase